jgi:hypothetical protein
VCSKIRKDNKKCEKGKKVEESKAGQNYGKVNMMMKRIPRAPNENI